MPRCFLIHFVHFLYFVVGVFGNTTGLMDATCSVDCWSGGCSPTSNLCFEGYYCPVGSISGTQMQCGGAGMCFFVLMSFLVVE